MVEEQDGRSSESGIGIVKVNPGHCSDWASFKRGLKAWKMIGDMVSPRKTPGESRAL